VAYDSGMVFISVYNPPAQYALNATTGQQIWRQSYGSSWDSSPVIYDGMVIQVTISGGVWSTTVLNETNGQLIRQFLAKGSTGTPLVDNGNVFIPSNDWTMWAFNLATGAELWQTVPIHDGTLQRYMYCSPASAGGAIYCQALNGTFYAINETDGRIFWSYALGSLGFGSPSIGDGCVFITNDAGLYAFRIGPGSGDWPMFCQNHFHRSSSQTGVEYVRWPLTQPRYLGDVSNTWVTARFVWCNKTITSAAIAWKIYFFDSSGNANVTDTLVFYINVAFHDVAVVNVAPSKTVIGQNLTAQVNVTVADQGAYTETFTVTVYANSTVVATENATLSSGNFTTLAFTWNTIGFSCGNYSIRAYASPVPNETDTENNSKYFGGIVKVTIPGDVDGDFRVAMGDVVSLCKAFGSTPGQPKYDPNCDIDGNGKIDMGDIIIAVKNFGQHYP
jgi:outer membrane protein assembly factor BamB